ncbi:GNAT family N-acetyltransferase [Microlunatus soli]|uniref:Ribosomal protein S18 acetylase RimI n=1 Tax=Microlunatus soli TaxID=630515 RepID=A0A1H1TB98_9ACTN|nr:GNAT family N-acetyltransferase [Microlunatus soli]SDS57532.1 Ribosomal protein S18 acetylase RimI [Microlunatus soli]
MTVTTRDATSRDQDHLARALFAAWQWRHPWDEQAFQDHRRSGGPDSYLDDFGRRAGDAGIVAEEVTDAGPQFAGAAWYRFFAADDHRAGFVAEDVPELVLAVDHRMRGRGVGSRLLRQLVAVAGQRGIRGLSLHVSNENRAAAGLYRSLGFELLHRHDDRGAVMFRATVPAEDDVRTC